MFPPAPGLNELRLSQPPAARQAALPSGAQFRQAPHQLRRFEFAFGYLVELHVVRVKRNFHAVKGPSAGQRTPVLDDLPEHDLVCEPKLYTRARLKPGGRAMSSARVRHT